MPTTDGVSIIQPLSVVVGASSLLSRRSGIGRMTVEIIKAARHRSEIAALALLMTGRLHDPVSVFARLAAEPEGGFAGPVPAPPPLLRAKRLIGGVPGLQAARRVKQRLAQRRSRDQLRAASGGRIVYHEPNMIMEPFDGPAVVTVNDLSWLHHPEYHPRERLEWIDRHLRHTLANAARFVAISRFTAHAMVQQLGLPMERIDVVPLAAAAQFQPQTRDAAAPILAQHGLADRHYVLAVSTLEPRKNFERLMAAHASLPQPLRTRFPLVIAGGSGWGSTLANATAERARRDGSLRLLGHLPDADLVSLYARAGVFAYVSIYEGFGLPVLEAMAAGAPVLASNTTATGETAGDAAELVEPLDVDAIAAGLRHVLESEDRAELLRGRGYRHAAAFSWDRTTTGLIASWARAID